MGNLVIELQKKSLDKHYRHNYIIKNNVSSCQKAKIRRTRKLG